MFEGKIKKQFESERERNAGLQSFRWTDLVARLSATRDLRDDCAGGECGGFEDFAQRRRQDETPGKRSFNHSGLNDGKGRNLGVGSTADGHAVQGDRETR